MNIVNKLTLRHLKENKGRSIVTTLGICVSVAMITAVFVAVASFLNFFGESTLVSNGNYHFQVTDTREKLEEIFDKHSNVIDSVGYTCSLDNNHSGYYVPGGLSKHNSIGSWVLGDEEYLKERITCKYDGNLPKNENEIMVEQDLIDKNEFDWKIGDTVEITSGARYTGEGVKFPVKGLYQFGEVFEETETKSYKIVGILHDNWPTKYTGDIVRGMGENESKTYTASVLLKNINPNSIKVINGIIDEFNFTKQEKPFAVSINYDYLDTKFAIDPDHSTVLTVLPMCAVILVVIMIASVALIYNAFGMSYAEKVRYLGMLSSVGATKDQKRRSVYFEGLVLGAIGIPIGFIAGVAGIGITLSLVGDKIIETGMINGMDNGSFKTVVPFYAVVCILVLSILTIFISIFRPARKASSITPIDAIRQTNEIKAKKKIKTPFFVRKIFGYEGELAHKNLKRNGRKSRIITVSIALSMILFLSCNYFCDMFVRAGNISDEIPYQISTSVEGRNREKFEKFLEENKEIDDFYVCNTDFYSNSFNETSNNDSDVFYHLDFFTENVLNNKYKDIAGTDIYFYFNVVEDDAFNKLCEFSGIDYNKLYDLGDNGELKCLVMNNISHKNGDDSVFNNNLLGESAYMYMIDNVNGGETTKFNSGYLFTDFAKYDENNYICHLNPSNSISCYIPLSAYITYLNNPEYEFDEYSTSWFSYGIVTDSHEKVTEEISDYFEKNDFDGSNVMDDVASMQMMNTTIFVIQVFIYGFISLITLITIFNIINTISTSIALRKKEFAMLKSVGITPKGFNKMVVLESAFYGLRAILAGVPLSILITFGINKALGETTIPFEINWLMILAVIVVVFIIIGMTMIYSVRKLKDDNIVETLKEDIS